MKEIVDNLNILEAASIGLKGKIDRNKIAYTGHSFGAFTAQLAGGASSFDPESGARIFSRDKRVKAILALSPPGPMFDVIDERSWEELQTPTLVTTGTWDSNAQFWPDWRAHLMSYNTALAGDKYALVIEGADHYLGNLICRPDRDEEPQQDALTMVNAVSIAFLDAYVKDITAAKDFLRDNPLEELTGKFAVLKSR